MIDTLARQLFKQLMEEEYPLSDIRLAAAYLEQTINVTACEEILRKAMKMSKEAGRNSAESIATIMELSIQADQIHFR